MSGPLFPRDEDTSPWDPGRSLGIIGLIFSISGVAAVLFFLLIAMVVALVGGIVSTVALIRSRRAGFTNGYAIAGVIIGFGILLVWIYLFAFVPLAAPPG